MRAQTSKNPGSDTATAASLRSADQPKYCSSSQDIVDVENTTVKMDTAGSNWHQGMTSEDVPLQAEKHGAVRERASQAASPFPVEAAPNCRGYAPGTPCPAMSLPEQLALLIVDMMPNAEGKELGEAFQGATELPPITKQSLGELDIQNIITNIKLRHDVNFDRDLSFRPNLDGLKGHEKMVAAARYWKALEAELELYVRLFRGTPPLLGTQCLQWTEFVQQAERRIPKMFATLLEVLKSLVPDRDHVRVEEHLDIPMLMQEIERGVCDLVRLAEWTASLLKEHCAPMRDLSIDKMVDCIRQGVSDSSSKKVVEGLRELLGILESMKLDVANHQIRNLKTLLIDDTINFERHYHLDRLVSGRARVNIDAARQWYESESAQFRQPKVPPQKDVLGFAQLVVSTLFSKGSRGDFPETFYLDHDRLRTLKSDFDDIIHFEICFDLFGQLLRGSGFHGPISVSSKQLLHASVAAIIREGHFHGPHQWWMNSENISMELIRHALRLSGRPPRYNVDLAQKANQHLLAMFRDSYAKHAAVLESYIIPQVKSSVTLHVNSSPIELFNALVPVSSPSTAPWAPSLQPEGNTVSRACTDTFAAYHPEQFADLTNRVTHIVILHWRTWGDVAYVQEEETGSLSLSGTTEEVTVPSAIPSTKPSPLSEARSPSSGNGTSANPAVLENMETGKSLDPGQEALEYAEPSFPS